MFGKLALRLCSDAQRWRVGCEALRKTPLQLLQFAKELIVLRVRHRRTVEDVILLRCAGENDPQLGGATMVLRPDFLRKRGRGRGRGKMRWRLILAGNLACPPLVLPLFL